MLPNSELHCLTDELMETTAMTAMTARMMPSMSFPRPRWGRCGGRDVRGADAGA